MKPIMKMTQKYLCVVTGCVLMSAFGMASSERLPQAVFLLVGGSNMVGHAPIWPGDRAELEGVACWHDEEGWRPATAPLHAGADNAGLGVGRSFAQVLREVAPHRSVGLVPAAVDDTALADWAPGRPAFEQAVRRVRQSIDSGGGTLAGILWHQGETDSTTWMDASTYAARWAEVTVAFRRELAAPDLPVVVGGLGDFLFAQSNLRYQRGFPYFREVGRQLKHVSHDGPQVGLAAATALDDDGEAFNFSSAAMRELGRRYAVAFLHLNPSWAQPMGQGEGGQP